MRIHRVTFTALLVGVIAVSLGLAAMSTIPPTVTSVSLRSAYTCEGSTGSFQARSISFSLDRTEFGWSGWMTLDPNHQSFNEYGSLVETTLMAGERIPIVLHHFGSEAAQGRTCYEVVQNRFDRQMFLVFPSQAGGTYRLIIRGDNPTATNVVFLESERNDELIARSKN